MRHYWQILSKEWGWHTYLMSAMATLLVVWTGGKGKRVSPEPMGIPHGRDEDKDILDLDGGGDDGEK